MFGDGRNDAYSGRRTEDAEDRRASSLEMWDRAGMKSASFISVVDDDESVRESLPDLLREFGFSVEAFASAEDFLVSRLMSETRCLILDMAMPAMTGPELQQELMRRGQSIPIIFITAELDETVRPRMLERGAVACLFKPFTESDLLNALHMALEGD